MSSAPSTWSNRIVDAGTAPPDQLLANPRNPRRHPGTQQDAMRAVLERVGWVQDVIVNRTTGHVLDGHMRVELAMRDNIPEVPVKYVELSEAEEEEVLATFDPIGSLAFMDRTALSGLLGDATSLKDDPRLDVLMSGLERRAAPETDASWLDDFRQESGGEPPRPPVREPEADDVWVNLSFTIPVDDRPDVMAAVRSCQSVNGLETSAQAIVAICREWLENQNG